ncbi:MAG TPA: trypsin-like peptidase domain-containing protein [Mobilitalea sp.]|nr:trypsin-like peptidase domain-containing protein [Mobilitalea sp.]
MKKHFKLFIAVLSLIIILAAGSKTAYAGEFKQSTLDGVVYVITVLPDENYDENSIVNYYTGTGFFVGTEDENPQYIITNCHVIQDFLLSGGSTGSGVLQIAYDKDTYEEAYVVTYDAEKDVAILKLAKPTDKRSALVLKTVDESYVGSSVFAVGYPYTADETVQAVNYFGKNDATVTGGRISRLVTESGSGRQLLQMDVSINNGNSGGPLVDENGYVVGINTLGSALDNNLNYAVSIEEAIPLLKNNNIPYEVAKESNLNLFLIIGAAGILLVIIVVVIIILNMNKKKMVPQPVNIPVAPMDQQVQYKRLNPVLHSMSSQHMGLAAAVSSQPISIGRDAAVCRVVYREGTPGVSSKHCQIYYDENNKTFVLTDLKSTYGTYLSNGQKLTPNVPYPLRPKDSFYLGEKDNTIYVDIE